MPPWSPERREAARIARLAEAELSRRHSAARREAQQQRDAARIEELRRLYGDDAHTVVLRRAVFDSLAKYAIGYADFMLGMGGSVAEVPALLLPEFRALMSPEIEQEFNRCFRVSDEDEA